MMKRPFKISVLKGLYVSIDEVFLVSFCLKKTMLYVLFELKVVD